MADMFPPSERVIYDRTPLKSVACEVRFPSLLRIESEAPVAFQELVRGTLPIFSKINTAVFGTLPPQILAAMGEISAGTSYNFSTTDGKYSAKLGSSSVSLTSVDYVRWDDFLPHLDLIIKALNDVYKPNFFSRVGLRYQNAIKRSELSLQERRWSELLIPELAGLLSLDGWQEPTEFMSIVRSKLDDDENFFRLQHGFGQIENDPEMSYLLDFDFYTDKQVEVSNVLGNIERLHSYSGDAFRWAISNELDAAMGPVTVQN